MRTRRRPRSYVAERGIQRLPALDKRLDGTVLTYSDRRRFVPSPKQIEFFRACADPLANEILFHGSVRAGKSQAACKLLVAWAMKHGGTYGVFRYTKQQLEDSTKKIMLQGEGGMPPALPPELIAYQNSTYNFVRLINGAEVIFRALEPDERGKIRNVTLAGAFIDQAEEMDEEGIEDFYDEIVGRCSAPGTPQKMVLVANPGPENHWLVDRFGLTPETRPARPRSRRVIHVTLFDNQERLDPRYFQRQIATRDTRPDYYARMVMGQWGVAGGKRFVFNRSHSVLQRLPFETIPEEWYVYEAIDWGSDHPCAYVWGAVDFRGALWITAEGGERLQTVAWHARQIKAIRENRDSLCGFGGPLEPSSTYLDPSAWAQHRQELASVAQSFRDNGIYPVRARNERIGGWQRIEEMLDDVMADGYSRLRFHGACAQSIVQIANLRRKPGTEDCEKVKDDWADCIRYIVMSRPATPQEKNSQEDAATREGMIRRLMQRKEQAASGRHIVIPTGH